MEIDDSLGRLFFENGKYHIYGYQNDLMNWSFTESNFTNGVLSVEFTHTIGDSERTGSVIFWRFKDSDNFYFIQVFGNQSFLVSKYLDGELILLHRYTWNSNINPKGNLNKIEIVFNGEVSDIYFNKSFTASIKDNSHFSGDVGIGAFPGQSSDVEVEFDNLFIYKFDPSNAFTPSQPKETPTKVPNVQPTMAQIVPTLQPTVRNVVLDITIKVTNYCPERHVVLFNGPLNLKYDVAPGKTIEWQGAKGVYTYSIDGIPGDDSPINLWETVWTLTLCP